MVLFFAAKPLMAAETEPNNNKATANTLALNGNNTGAIAVAGDEDWFAITTNADGKLSVTATISNGLTLRCYIYDNDGTTLINSGYSSNAVVVASDGLAAGTYYVKLVAYYAAQTPAYTISNTLTLPAQANDAEPNDSRAQANVLPLNGQKTGHAGYYYNLQRDTADWYKVTTDANGKLRVSATSGNGETVRVYLYDNNGTTLLSSAYSSATASFDADGLAAGTYYVKVFCFYNYDFAPYTLSDTLIKPSQEDDIEPNDSRAQAKVLPLNGEKTGHAGYYYNLKRDTADWYKVTTNADGKLRVSATSGNGETVRIYLYDNNGTTLLNSAYSSATASFDADGLAAGTYYVKVFCFYNYDFAPYTLSDTLIKPLQANDAAPNDSRDDATVLAENGTTTGHAGYYYNLNRDTADWYKVTTTTDGILRMTLTSGNGETVRVYLYDNNGTTLLSSDYSSSIASLDVNGLAAGTYYVKVFCYYNYKFAPYTLTNTVIKYAYSGDAEPNAKPYQAKTILANNATDGHVGFYYNNKRDTADWWKVNYTGTSGSLSFTVNQEPYNVGGSYFTLYFQVYKDTAGSAIHSSYSAAATRVINLTGLAQGYYWIKVFAYYNYQVSSYSFTNTFTQSKATIAIRDSVISTTCDSTNSITFKCTKSKAPYTVQLYRYKQPYRAVRKVNNTANFTYTNLPAGIYYATVFGDGATGSAFGKTRNIVIIPEPVNPRTTAISSVQGRLNWDAVGCAKYFSIQFRKATDTAWTTRSTNGNTTFYVLKNLSAATTYYWRVASADSSNNVTGTGAYTDSISFTTAVAFASTVAEDDAMGKVATGKSTLSVYPNPVNTSFSIQLNNVNTNTRVVATLSNMNNTIVWSRSNITVAALIGSKADVSNLPNGMYMLQVTDMEKNTKVFTKVIIAK